MPPKALSLRCPLQQHSTRPTLPRKARNIGADALGHVLAGLPTYMIMLVGRWKSDSFLVYICKQVAEFSNNISKQKHD